MYHDGARLKTATGPNMFENLNHSLHSTTVLTVVCSSANTTITRGDKIVKARGVWEGRLAGAFGRDHVGGVICSEQ